jgi:hypothetical protein
MTNIRFFKEHDLSCGQCPWTEDGTPLPPFEPVGEEYARSHQMVEKLRNEIENFDAIGGYEPDKWEAVISNLYLLADLATAGAQHMRRHLDHLAAEEAAYQARVADYRATESKGAAA